MQYGSVTPAVLKELEHILGPQGIVTDSEKMVDYSHDEFALEHIRRLPDVVVKPENTDQVAQVLRLANAKAIPITARGGGTGLCGGCVPVCGGIVMSFQRMNRVIEIDTDNFMAVVEPGVTLAEFYKAIEGSGLFFAPHPGDEGATIGGVIATNAGGARAVKYGVIRNFVRGVEVVLADGAVMRLGGKLMKSSTGYSLLNLMIGSEGTLGIVTQATISLSPKPAAMVTLVVPYDDLKDAIRTVPVMLRAGIVPLAVEFLERDSVDVVEDMTGKKWPCADGRAYLMVILDGSSESELLALAEKVGETCLTHAARDVFVADSNEKQDTILALRSRIYDAMRTHMFEILDVTVPRAAIADFVAGVHRIGQELGVWLPTFGHAADGNVHTNLMTATWRAGVWSETPGWKDKCLAARQRIHDHGQQFGGIISGEHGIGLVKKEYMPSFLDARQIAFMQAIKQSVDPNGILNPGKIFDE